MLLDVGPGSVHGLARHRKPWSEITHVVLSHFHTDHFGDLPHFLFALKWASASRDLPLRVLGPPGLLTRIDGLRAAYGEYIEDPGCSVTYEEIDRQGAWSSSDGSLGLSFTPARHTPEAVAMRVEVGGCCLGYTGDTGPLPGLGPFFRGVDILISECAYADPAPPDMHLSPRSVASMAGEAEPGLLVLTHLYPPLSAETVPLLVAEAGYGGRVVCASDGDGFPLAAH